MFNRRREQLSGFILAVALLPRLAQAQPAPRSFGDLPRLLKPDDVVVVIDETGRQTQGRITEVSPSSLLLVIREQTATTPPVTKRFSEGNVAKISTTESVLNGALIGAAAGTGLAMWDYLIDPSEPGNALIFAVAIGVGTALGAGIDALHQGGKVLYVWSRRVPGLGPRPAIAGTFAKSFGDTAATAGGFSLGAYVGRRISVSIEALRLDPSTTSVTGTSEMVPLNESGSRYLLGPVAVQSETTTRKPYSISGFVGMHPPTWRRVNWTVLAGFTAARFDRRGSREKHVAIGPETYRTELNDFSRSEMQLGPTFGVDSAIAVSHHVNLVPNFRLDLGFHRAVLRTGVGVQWAF